MRWEFNNNDVLLDCDMTYDEYKKIPNRRFTASKYGDRILVKVELITNDKKVKQILNKEDLQARKEMKNRISAIKSEVGKYYTNKYIFMDDWDSDEDENNLSDMQKKLIQELIDLRKKRKLGKRLFQFNKEKLKTILNTAGFDFPTSLEKGYIISYTDYFPKVELKKSVSFKF